MKRKANGQAGPPDTSQRSGERPSTGVDKKPGSAGADADPSPDRESGLKQAGLSDVGGTGPRRKPGK